MGDTKAWNEIFDDKPTTGPIEIGSYISDYRLEKVIGEGGMSRVFIGVHPEMGSAAIKVITLEQLDDQAVLDNLAREVVSLSKVEHPGVVRVKSFDKKGKAIIMEHIIGVPLNKYQENLRNNDQFGSYIIEILKIYLEIAKAFAHVHRRNIVHRDLKPDNVLITSDQRPKIIDFGISDLEGSTLNIDVVAGTLQYMAPEQLQPGKKITNQSDIYAFGLMLYESITGKSIYQGHNLAGVKEALRLQTSKQFLPEALQKASLPPHILPIIENCLKEKKEDRYQIMDQVVGAIDLAIAVEDHNHVQELIKSKKKDGRIRKLVKSGWALAAVMTMVAVALSVFAFGYRGSKKKPPAIITKQLPCKKPQREVAPVKPREKATLAKVAAGCKKKLPKEQRGLSELTLCIRRKAWSYYHDNEIDDAERIAKKAIVEYWKKLKWPDKKKVKMNFVSLNKLLGKIYRIRAHKEKGNRDEWDHLSRRAAHFEATAKYWEKRSMK